MLGLSELNSGQDANYTSIDYAIYPTLNGVLYIYERGVYKGYFGTYTTGDDFSIIRTGDVVKYYKNNALIYTSTITSSETLFVDTALYSYGATIANAALIISEPELDPNTGISISTCSELQDIENNLTATYELSNNINCSGFDFKQIRGTFTGKLDGKGFSINGITLNTDVEETFGSDNNIRVRPKESNGFAMFNLLDNAEIVDIEFNGFDIDLRESWEAISRSRFAAVLSSMVINSTIDNVDIINASINIENNVMSSALLAGFVEDSEISNSSASGTISQRFGNDSKVSGLIVYLNSSTLRNCQSFGDITFDMVSLSGESGGLIANVRGNSLVEDSISNIDINSPNFIPNSGYSAPIGKLIGRANPGSSTEQVVIRNSEGFGSLPIGHTVINIPPSFPISASEQIGLIYGNVVLE